MHFNVILHNYQQRERGARTSYKCIETTLPVGRYWLVTGSCTFPISTIQEEETIDWDIQHQKYLSSMQQKRIGPVLFYTNT